MKLVEVKSLLSFTANLRTVNSIYITAQKIKFSIMDFFSKCDQICSLLWIWSHLLKKSLMKNFIFCAVIMICAMLDISKNNSF